jgi:arylsulfatase A-like enzyme
MTRKAIWVCALVVFGLALVATVLTGLRRWHHQPNVVLIQIDTLRADRVGCYGYSRPTTPNLDRFARTGVQFRNAYSVTSWTLPAVVSLLTGLLPSRHDVVDRASVLPDSTLTVSHILHDRGYNTAAISANFSYVHPSLSFPKPPLHLGQGFDTFRVLWRRADITDREGEIVRHQRVRTVRASAVAKKMKEWVFTAAEPFFLFAVYIDPHYGYEPAPQYAQLFEPVPMKTLLTGFMQDFPQLAEPFSAADLTHMSNLYDGEIRSVDDAIGGVLAALDEKGIAGRTIVIILSDHGEEFRDHGRMLHGQTLYEESVRIPLLMGGPGIPQGVVVDEPVSIMDVMPTVLELAGLRAPTGIDGRSLISTWRNPGGPASAAAPRALVFELDNEPVTLNGPRPHSRALRQRNWKIITGPRNDLELYDLAADPGETHNLAATSPQEVARLRAALDRQMRSVTTTPRPLPTLSETDKERLRALGYATD